MANQAFPGITGSKLANQGQPTAGNNFGSNPLINQIFCSPVGPYLQSVPNNLQYLGLLTPTWDSSKPLDNTYGWLAANPGLTTTTQSRKFFVSFDILSSNSQHNPDLFSPVSPVIAPTQTLLSLGRNDLRYPPLNSKQRVLELGKDNTKKSNVVTKTEKEEENTQTTAMSTRRLDRASAWTHREEVFLWGIMVQMFLSRGTLFHPLKPTKVVDEEKRLKAAKKKKQEGTALSKSEEELLAKNIEEEKEVKNVLRRKENGVTLSAVEEDLLVKMHKGDGNFNKCFREVKVLYDKVWNKFLAQNPGENRNYKRSWQALKRHYKAMKTEYSKNGDGKFERLYSKWRSDYNLNGKLLDQGSLSKLPAENIPVEYHERANAWDKIEESFLVGAIMTRFLLHGSLTTPRPKIPKGSAQATVSKSNDPKDCWFAVKKAYDFYWATYRPNKDRKPRTVDALSRHYKIMKRRIVDRPGTKTFAPFYEEFLEIQKAYQACKK